MIRRIQQFLSLNAPTPAAPAPRVPDGRRVYAIGDIHGRLDLFQTLLAQIEADETRRDETLRDTRRVETLIVLLGDLVDRGPDSAGVIAAARALCARREVRTLMGNHEEMFLAAMEDDRSLRHFLRIGGKETVLSYGIGSDAYRAADLTQLRAMLCAAVPAEDLAFLAAMEDHVMIGDYLFVHAGVRPGLALADQKAEDLRWIREPFLSHNAPHAGCVVHGHTIRQDVELWPSARAPARIGIDTGAYETGRLTAIGLQGSERWFISTAD